MVDLEKYFNKIIGKILDYIIIGIIPIILLVGFTTFYLSYKTNLTYGQSLGITFDLFCGDSPTGNPYIPKEIIIYNLARSVRFSGFLLLPIIIGIFIGNIQKRIEDERIRSLAAIAELTEGLTLLAAELPGLTVQQRQEFVKRVMAAIREKYNF